MALFIFCSIIALANIIFSPNIYDFDTRSTLKKKEKSLNYMCVISFLCEEIVVFQSSFALLDQNLRVKLK